MAPWILEFARACAFAAALAGGIAAAEPNFLQGEPVLDVQDAGLLAALEQRGFAFGALVGDPSHATLRDLHAGSAAYRTIADAIGADVTALRAEMKANGRVLFEVTDQNIGRIIDLRWLQSPLASFRLAGVVNRLDRMDFAEAGGEGNCGEVRFIYRLAYRFRRGAITYSSRMPFNVNVVYEVPKDKVGSCRDVATAWVPSTTLGEPDEQLDWLLKGPFDRARLTLKQIEINAQVVRFPSGMETEFGGQAIYLLRIFGVRPGLAVYQKPLENTPDVAKVSQDGALRQRLVDYVKANIEAVDRGVFRLPDEFLATKALSFSTFGSARFANHPFAALISESDLAGLPLAGYLRSPKAVIERLDTSTCVGCHQSNATAGFHFIGFDDPDASAFNRVKIAVSSHYYAESVRRKAYLAAIIAGREPNRFRPLPVAPPAAWAGEGLPSHQPAALTMPCLPEAAKAHFGSAWSCAASACQVIATNKKIGIEFGL